VTLSVTHRVTPTLVTPLRTDVMKWWRWRRW